jgi:hypothetical protein
LGCCGCLHSVGVVGSLEVSAPHNMLLQSRPPSAAAERQRYASGELHVCSEGKK